MGFFKKAFEKRDVNGYSNEEFLRLLGIDTLTIDKDKLGEITYFTCCKVLSESIAKLPLKLYKEADKGIQKATEHYLYQLLKVRPNPYCSSWAFWSSVELNKNHFGNAYVYIDTETVGRNAGRIKGLYMLPSDKVTIWVDNAGIISKDNAIWYVYTDNNLKQYKFNYQQILHFKTGMSLDGISGLTVRDILKVSVENAQAGEKFINNYFKNGLLVRGILQYTGDIEPKAMQVMRQKFETMASGLSNAGRILPMPLGFSFQTLNANMVDSQFLQLNKYTAQQIAAAFGIKPNQLNEQGKYNNLEMQEREFYTDTLLGILTMYEQELTFKLLTDKERNSGYFFKFNVDAILRADFKTRMDGYGVAINNGIMTPNECRQKEDLPSDDNGDQLIVNGTYIPLKMVGQQYTNNGSSGGEKN